MKEIFDLMPKGLYNELDPRTQKKLLSNVVRESRKSIRNYKIVKIFYLIFVIMCVPFFIFNILSKDVEIIIYGNLLLVLSSHFVYVTVLN